MTDSPLEVGATAPDFTLKDQNGVDVTLSAFRGSKNVLLVFYPFAFSGICTGELHQIRDDLGSYGEVIAEQVNRAHLAALAWAQNLKL